MKRAITKQFIRHRLQQLEIEIVLTSAAVRRWRGGVPIELHDIIDSALWARHMMDSAVLEYWLGDDSHVNDDEHQRMFKTDYDIKTTLPHEDEDLRKIHQELRKIDEERGITPRGI